MIKFLQIPTEAIATYRHAKDEEFHPYDPKTPGLSLNTYHIVGVHDDGMIELSTGEAYCLKEEYTVRLKVTTSIEIVRGN